MFVQSQLSNSKSKFKNSQTSTRSKSIIGKKEINNGSTVGSHKYYLYDYAWPSCCVILCSRSKSPNSSDRKILFDNLASKWHISWKMRLQDQLLGVGKAVHTCRVWPVLQILLPTNQLELNPFFVRPSHTYHCVGKCPQQYREEKDKPSSE